MLETSKELLLLSSRYPNISCELLTSDVSQINDRLGEDEKLLMKLYGFLQNEPPLNPLLASFFSKVLSILIGRKPEQVNQPEEGVVCENGIKVVILFGLGRLIMVICPFA